MRLQQRMARSEIRFPRWVLLAVAALAMATAGSYQFGWSSIRLALGARIGGSETALGTVFTLFVVFQTVAQFPAGWFRDRYGPRVPLLVGACCLTAGFAGVGLARSLAGASLSYAVGGIGVAIVYTVTVNTAVKWFTRRRGLATGVVTMAYSGGSFLLIPPIRAGVNSTFGTTVLVLGALTGSTALIAAFVLRDPDLGDDATDVEADGEQREAADDGPADGTDDQSVDATDDASAIPKDERSYTWRQVIRTWQFWLLYAVFVVVNGIGLMVISKVVDYASVLALPTFAGTASASMIALADACGILVVGGVSDRVGSTRSVATSLVLSGLSLGGAVLVGESGFAWGFVALVAATIFFRSPPFAIFPNVVGEYYGRSHSSANYAVLYTAKLIGGVFGGVIASVLVVSLGWSTSFAIGGGLLVVAGVSLAFLRPV